VVREVVIQGQVEPWQSVAVSAETVGIVSRIVARKGQRVQAGELLLELNMDDRQAKLKEARALLKLRQTEHQAALKLNSQGLQSDTQLAVAESQLEAAKAVLQQIELDIEHTRLRAPFAGVINDQLVELGDYLDRGAPAMLLVDDSRLLAVGNVPQQSIRFVHPDLTANVKLLTGEELQGKIRFVSASADASTRSFRVEVEIDNQAHQVAAGLSGEIRIPVETVPGHFLSPAMLTLSDEGELGIKAVDMAGIVVFHPVHIIKTTAKGAWVSGLPQQIRVITLGQGFVRAGDKVEAIADTAADGSENQQSSLSPSGRVIRGPG
jgi:multidrug efflux system membrane fusion protein